MSLDFSSYIKALSENEFDETPVDLETFCYSPEYLALPKLSDYQMQMLEAMTQIYKEDTLKKLYGEEEGKSKWKKTYREVILQLGKGSGKDYTSTIACAYIVYLLLCLRDPAAYYGKPPGDSIDIINIAINSQQAKNVFFKGFKTRIERSPWFQGKYSPTADAVKFDKSITVHSGHSEREAWEGYNVLVVILDEISGFAMENTSGNTLAKTASDIYKMYSASVSSRFPDYGKILLLSFPRFKNDFIQQRYNAAIGDKEVIIKSKELVVNPDLSHDSPDNKITVEWEEDKIVNYRQARTFALKRPTWEINPLRTIEEFTNDFYDDYEDALSRFACMPPDSIDGFFKSRQKMQTAFRNTQWNISETGQMSPSFKPIDGKKYYIHVDLAQKIDRCVVSMAHVENWVEVKVGTVHKEIQPKVIVDAIRWWTPSSTETVDFSDVKQFILDLYRMGFNVPLVTFDRWNSHQIMEELKAYGIKTEVLSVAKKHYQDMALLVTEERLEGPNNEILIEELMRLRIIRDKIDHPRSGSKDLADAVCGSIYNAIAHTPKELNKVIEIHTYGQTDKREKEEAREVEKRPVVQEQKPNPPADIQNFLERLKSI